MKQFYFAMILCSYVFASCKHQDPVVPACKGSYAMDIKPIVVTKCALSGCHLAGAAMGDFNNYADLKARVDNGRLRTNVYELKIMPPATMPQLTDVEKEQIKCWLDNGAAQN